VEAQGDTYTYTRQRESTGGGGGRPLNGEETKGVQAKDDGLQMIDYCQIFFFCPNALNKLLLIRCYRCACLE